MRILLDENLDWRLSRDLHPHEVRSVPLIGWSGIENGTLLSRAEKEFDVLITMDTHIAHQQNIARFNIAVIALRARSNRLADTRPLMAHALRALETVKPGTIIVVENSARG